MNSLRKKLIIVGASGMGREVFDLCRKMPENGHLWDISGFLDNRPDLLAGLGDYPPILGSPFGHNVSRKNIYVCAVGEGFCRLEIARYLKSKGAQYQSIVPSGAIGCHSTVGDGCIVYPGSGCGPNCRVGDFVFLNSKTDVGHDSVLGDGATLAAQVCVAGWVTIGTCVFIGSNATICPHAVLEDHAYVGAGSVVLRRVKARTKVFGNPALKCGDVAVDADWLLKQQKQQPKEP